MKFEIEIEDGTIEELKVKMNDEYDNDPTAEDVVTDILYIGAVHYGHDDIAKVKKVEE